MLRPSRKAVRARKPANRRLGSTLDARASEAIARFVRVLAHCGCTPEDIGQEVARACREIPRSWATKAMAAQRYLDDAAHVLTLWFSDPAYLDARGKPRRLPVRGPGGSLEALAYRANPKLEARALLQYLVRHGAIRRQGQRYIPKERMLLLRNAGGPDHVRHLRALGSMLRTLEHNTQPKRRVPGWYEVFADNPNFPVSAIPRFDRRVRVHADKLLRGFDTEMVQEERARKPGESTVRIGIGVYRFEEAPLRPLPARRRRASR
jgi:hypothetical protein